MNNHDVDVRVFRRYEKEAGFTLTVGGNAYSARTVDYSLNSVGILAEGNPPLSSGDMIDLEIPELGIRQKGMVIWATPHAHSVRAGIERLGPLNGSLSLYRLSDVLIGLQRTVKTGILEFLQGSSVRSIYIKNGNMVAATSNLDEHRLGDILRKEGKMTSDQYEQAAERKQRTNERYVSILVDSGCLKPSGLIETLELQTNIIIESLFGLEQADFEFREEQIPAEAVTTLHISAADLIFHELKKTADADKMSEYFFDRTVDFSSTPLNLFQEIRLDADVRRLLTYVDGKTKVSDIIRLSSMDSNQAIRNIFALVEARILETKDAGGVPNEIAAEEIGNPLNETFGSLIDKIDRADIQFRTLNYYDILGIDPGASAVEIKKAYYRAAREYHPDRHFSLPEDIKRKLLDIFNCITRAYLTLKDYGKRMEYDQSLKIKSSDAESTRGAPVSAMEESQQGDRFGQTSDAGSGENEKSEIARSNFDEGKSKFKKGKFQEAAHFFATAIYFDHSVAEYHYYYGLCFSKTGKPKEALQSLNKAIEISPNIPDILAEAGHIYLTLNCPVRAKGLFNRAIRLQPDHKRAKEGIEVISQLKTDT